MRTSTLFTLPLIHFAAQAAALPQLAYLARGKCSAPGQFICVSPTTYALCDASLRGIIQPLAAGDSRCGGASAAGAPLAVVPPSANAGSTGSGTVIPVVPTTCSECTSSSHGSTHGGAQPGT
ncbi:hypothetical protein CLCR_01757 [Cladophialophora carrionii]|uniref:Uncharacterized protein n=1 Tax=Cladophialophora carrionii TaxID=86049 RepID=A0A1C1CB79_9EURO|nr:hypothetical protein CLCR_01757 [Cladophialophora carrionii]